MTAVRHRSPAWAGYAAFAWAAAYAIGVRCCTGGSARGGRLLMLLTAAATLAITAFACSMVVARSL